MLFDLLRHGANVAPDRPLIVTSQGAATYSGCLERSCALATGLSMRSILRAACVVRDPTELVTVLCASSAVGTELCIYPNAANASSILDYTKAFGHEHVIADWEPALSKSVLVHPVSELAATTPSLPHKHGAAPVMILTTGTTGKPKAARYDWARLVAAAQRLKSPRPTRWLLAYNLNQFGGLQVLLHVLASTGTLVVPPSNRPSDAIAATRELNVTHASATPTFWRLVTAMLDEDAARSMPLEQITLSGEAVPALLLSRLHHLFPAARISQVYATTEFGTIVSVKDGRSGLPLAVLQRREAADVQLRVVDGELHARSRAGMLGYYGQADVDDGWRSTGDLVEIREDRLEFVGRTGDTINVGGVKVHPLLVENVVGAIRGVRLVRAFGHRNPITGEIVALEVVPSPDADTCRLESAIRSQCDQLPAAAHPRLIRFVDEIQVRGNKVARGV